MRDKLKIELHKEFKSIVAQDPMVDESKNKSTATPSEEMAIDGEEASCRNPGTQTGQETGNEYTCPRNGLNESWYVHTEPPSNPSPSGPKRWREGMAKRQQRSRHQTAQHQKKSKPLSTLQRLEADILDFKEIAAGHLERNCTATHGVGFAARIIVLILT
jgi:hypothetical protein